MQVIRLTCATDTYVQSTSETDEVDNMLWTFVVEHEVKKLNARQRNPKGSSSKSK